MLSRFFLFLSTLISTLGFSLTNQSDDFNPDISYKLVQEGAVLIDVRSSGEYASGHVKNALNIPHTTIEANKELIKSKVKHSKNKAIVVYCRSGQRSGIAQKKLKSLGFKKVVNHGSYKTWKKK